MEGGAIRGMHLLHRCAATIARGKNQKLRRTKGCDCVNGSGRLAVVAAVLRGSRYRDRED